MFAEVGGGAWLVSKSLGHRLADGDGMTKGADGRARGEERRWIDRHDLPKRGLQAKI